MAYSYWKEALECALDEAGLFGIITDDKIEEIAQAMKFAAEMEGEATGRIYIPNPLLAEIENIKKRHANEITDMKRDGAALRRMIAREHNLDNPEMIGTRDGQTVYYHAGRTRQIG